MTRYPLTWPAGWRRMKSSLRTRARFGSIQRHYHNEGTDSQPTFRLRSAVTVAGAAGRIMNSLRMLDVPENEIIVSTNLQVRLDGLPRSGQGEPLDPGVAVYWKKRGASIHKVMAIDRYDRVAGNLAAVAATLEAMRLIERHGGAEILDRAFTGFLALPAPEIKDWRLVLGLRDGFTLEKARKRYHELVKERHPDCGGSDMALIELNTAWAEAQHSLG